MRRSYLVARYLESYEQQSQVIIEMSFTPKMSKTVVYINDVFTVVYIYNRGPDERT